MRVMVLVEPQFAVPPEQFPALIQSFVAWREKYRNRMEAFEFFAGSAGGFGILNVADEGTLNQIMMEYAFSPYSHIQVRPILDGDAALAQWQQAVQQMGQ